MKQLLSIIGLSIILGGVLLSSNISADTDTVDLIQQQTPLSVFLNPSSEISEPEIIPEVVSSNGEVNECSLEGITQQINEITSSATDPNNLFAMITTFTGNQRAYCDGLAFTSQEYGRSAVIGPFELPAGVYIINTTANEMFSASATLLTDDCGFDMLLFSIIHFSQVEDAKESVRIDRDCELLIDISARGDWKMSWDKIR